VWRFLTSRWTELEPMMGTAFALSDIVDAAGSFCDADMRNEVERFFSDKAATARRTLRLSLDRIDACRDFRLRQEARLGEWLGKM
jgi:hypothetical protein